jgi:hypothetical protein
VKESKGECPRPQLTKEQFEAKKKDLEKKKKVPPWSTRVALSVASDTGANKLIVPTDVFDGHYQSVRLREPLIGSYSSSKCCREGESPTCINYSWECAACPAETVAIGTCKIGCGESILLDIS